MPASGVSSTPPPTTGSAAHAAALARKEYPGFLEDTYQQAANDVAYYNK
jgi:hypothetical protein